MVLFFLSSSEGQYRVTLIVCWAVKSDYTVASTALIGIEAETDYWYGCPAIHICRPVQPRVLYGFTLEVWEEDDALGAVIGRLLSLSYFTGRLMMPWCHRVYNAWCHQGILDNCVGVVVSHPLFPHSFSFKSRESYWNLAIHSQWKSSWCRLSSGSVRHADIY